jgi:hypothetical protein
MTESGAGGWYIVGVFGFIEGLFGRIVIFFGNYVVDGLFHFGCCPA